MITDSVDHLGRTAILMMLSLITQERAVTRHLFRFLMNFEPDPWVYSLVPWARLVQSSRAGGEMKVAGRFVPTVSVRVGLTSAVLVSVALAHPRSLQTFE